MLDVIGLIAMAMGFAGLALRFRTPLRVFFLLNSIAFA
jgi:hypothetical protein